MTDTFVDLSLTYEDFPNSIKLSQIPATKTSESISINVAALNEKLSSFGIKLSSSDETAALFVGDSSFHSIPVIHSEYGNSGLNLSLIGPIDFKFHDPGLRNTSIGVSDLSFIDSENSKLYYCGHSVESLINDNVPFEDIIFLLLNKSFPNSNDSQALKMKISENMFLNPSISSIADKILSYNTKPMSALSAVIAVMDLKDNSSLDPVCVVAHLAAVVALICKNEIGASRTLEPIKEVGFSENFIRSVFGKEMDQRAVPILDALLCLHAEHEQNASTFACCCTASAGSSIIGSISTGINTLAGNLHGGANEDVMKMLDDLSRSSNVEFEIKSLVKNATNPSKGGRKVLIPGTGHRVYKGSSGDPRAKCLYAMLKNDSNLIAIIDKSPYLKNLFQIAESLYHAISDNDLLREKGVVINVDFWSGLLFSAIGIPSTMFTLIFALSRSVGWCAHSIPACKSGIVRPMQIYQGDIKS